MKATKAAICTFCVVMALTGSGCGSKKTAAEVTPTPVPTATPVPVTATPTPMPTPTSAPKLIGKKTDTAKYITLINKTGVALREVYIQDPDTGEWGNNLVPADSSVRDKEQVEMYYEPLETGSYNLKIITEKAETFEMDSVELEDMDQASLYIEDGNAFLKYMSLSTKSETTTSGADSSEGDDSEETQDSSNVSSNDSSYDNSYDSDYEDSGDYGDDSYDDSNDGYDDNSYDNSYDDTSDEDGSGDNGDSGDGSGGNYDDETDSDSGSDSDIVWDEDGNWSEY